MFHVLLLLGGVILGKGVIKLQDMTWLDISIWVGFAATGLWCLYVHFGKVERAKRRSANAAHKKALANISYYSNYPIFSKPKIREDGVIEYGIGKLRMSVRDRIIIAVIIISKGRLPQDIEGRDEKTT